MKSRFISCARYLIFLGVTYALTAPILANGQSICATVPAAASSGVSFGNVIAGQTYAYTASGCAQRSLEPNMADPDGNQYSNTCSQANFIQSGPAGAGATCPGLTLFSLVGKINGGSCIQLGKSGTFVASSSGQLMLYFNDDNYFDNSGSWNVCLTPVQQMCTNVPAAASSGIAIGDIVAGQSYTYQASGCIQRSLEPNVADPDGNQYSNTCSPANFIQSQLAGGAATCPGLTLFSLVGKINGGPCLQLGKSGSFVAAASGTLVLYCNDDNYSDNSGSWSVCITPAQQACLPVPASAASGVFVGNVVAGQTYTYQASGCIQRSLEPNTADPDGNQYTNGCTAATFVTNNITAGSAATCPGLVLFSLVGKINGGSCIQLGKGGSFVAPASGALVVYCNDDNYGDNSGSWNVCIDVAPAAIVSQVCQPVPAAASGGIIFGNVVAGQAYAYSASGCAQRSLEPNMADPDGNQYYNGCTALITNNVVAGTAATCPGLTLFSLVGKINGGSCIQLGKSGSFVASSSGQLVLYFNDDNYSDNSGSWNVCVTPSQPMCTNVPAAASSGVFAGNVVAGQSYAYTASGCAQRSLEPNMADPDGNQYFNSCTTIITNNIVAGAAATCPGLTLFSLVGKVNGGSCIQLGKNGVFTAPSSGALTLYFNDDNYFDNSGSWNVCITTAPTQSLAQVCQPVLAASSQGAVFGDLVAGHTYSYSAAGCVQRSFEPNMADPDGNQYSNACASANFIKSEPAGAGATCPGLKLFSLVGKIAGGPCIQLGKAGDFVAPASGQLVLYFNDDNYDDNSGAWDVCLTDLPETIKGLKMEGNNFRVTWTTLGGRIYVLQSSANSTNGITGFVDISPPIVVPVLGASTTNFLDPSAVTGLPQRQYRVRVIH